MLPAIEQEHDVGDGRRTPFLHHASRRLNPARACDYERPRESRESVEMSPKLRSRVGRCALFVVASLTVCCGPRVRAEAAQPGSSGELPAPVDQSAAAPAESTQRDVHRYVITTLMQAGYRCNEDDPTQCMAEDGWQTTVSTRIDANATWIGFDSTSQRAAGRTCGELRQLVDGMASTADWFTVSCNDTRQELRMSTWVTYSQELDVAAWMQAHRQSRFNAYRQLEAAGATAR
jgi:hypothetical protein